MPDQGPSRFESLKQGAKEAFEGVMSFAESKLAIGLIGAVGLVGGGIAVANQLGTETASAANVPEATASDLRQDCINQGLNFPKPFKAKMTHPGQFNKHNIQQTTITSTYEPESPDCFDLVDDLRQYKLQLKMGKGWHSTNRFWIPLADKNDGTNTVTETALGDDDLYACRPVRVMIRNRVVDENTRKTVAMKVRPESVQVVGKKKVC